MSRALLHPRGKRSHYKSSLCKNFLYFLEYGGYLAALFASSQKQLLDQISVIVLGKRGDSICDGRLIIKGCQKQTYMGLSLADIGMRSIWRRMSLRTWRLIGFVPKIKRRQFLKSKPDDAFFNVSPPLLQLETALLAVLRALKAARQEPLSFARTGGP